ncbi:MAG: restriction endonuclease subunit S [Parabacteroides sp.]|nr:restriction endonuclease subunit S [Parabacteroides sp.]
MKLFDIAYYVNDKISSNDIKLSEYITTDSILPNKGGIESAKKMPPSPCNLIAFKKGDVLISNIRPYLKKIWFAEFKGGCSSDVLVIRARNDNMSKYLYSVLLQDSFYSYIMKSAKGSKMPRGDKEFIMNFPILNIKNKYLVGEFIGNISEKIALNFSINQILESMAKQLYDYWFVQFDFPDENGCPYKSSGGEMIWSEELKREIPKGWRIKKISDILTLSKQSIKPLKSSNKVYKHYSIPEYDKSGTYANELGDLINSDKFVVKENNILVSKLNPWVSRVIWGQDLEDLICSTEFMVWEPNKYEYKGFLYMLAKSKSFIAYCTQAATGTSNSHKRVSPNYVLNYKIAFNDYIVERFYKTIDYMQTLIVGNIENNSYLRNLRDELLPLLMNGQVSIKTED